MKIYLDVCCLCRPFDDQMIGRIRLEVTAIQEIIRRCATREFSLVTSEAIDEELSKIPDIRKRLRDHVRALLCQCIRPAGKLCVDLNNGQGGGRQSRPPFMKNPVLTSFPLWWGQRTSPPAINQDTGCPGLTGTVGATGIGGWDSPGFRHQ